MPFATTHSRAGTHEPTVLVVRAAAILVFEGVAAVWVFGPLREGRTTYGILIAVGVAGFAAGLIVATPWVVLATIPPLIASAPLPRPPGNDASPLGLMLFLWPLMLAVVIAGVLLGTLLTRHRSPSAHP